MRLYLFHSVLNFIFLLKSKKREKNFRLCANIYGIEIWTASYLKKFDFVGFFTKQKTIKYERPHLHPYYSKDSIIFKCSIVKRVLNCVCSLWSCAHNPINSHICKSQKKWLLYLLSQNITPVDQRLKYLHWFQHALFRLLVSEIIFQLNVV